MIFASAELATRDAHWLAQLSALAAISLLRAVIYLTAHAMVTKTDQLVTAPHHIHKAPNILRWIAAFTPLLTIVGGIIDLYANIVRIGYEGIDIATPYVLVGGFLFFPALGLVVSLFALSGTALIFWKHRQ